jgi:hypothetical protein
MNGPLTPALSPNGGEREKSGPLHGSNSLWHYQCGAWMIFRRIENEYVALEFHLNLGSNSSSINFAMRGALGKTEDSRNTGRVRSGELFRRDN